MIDFNKKISKREFIKIIAKSIYSLSILSLIPLKAFAQSARTSFKMKIKQFNRSALFSKHDLAG